MEQQMASLAKFQICGFFERNNPITQQQCDELAESITNKAVSPTPVQGGSSYTVTTGTCIVQFRDQDSPFDLELFHYIEQAYRGFTPRHEGFGELGNVHVYRMTNMGGVSMYLARDALYRNDFDLLGSTVQSFASFFASAWHNTPAQMPRKDPSALSREYLEKLRTPRDGLPTRFRQSLDYVQSHLPRLFADDWPQVPNHVELLEDNIHVDPETGRITGVCDWPEAEIGPFGMSLGGLETMLGINRVNKGFCYHTKQQYLRKLFHQSLEQAMGMGLAPDDSRERMRVATLVGLFLTKGFEYAEDGAKAPAGEGSSDLADLAVILPQLGAPGF